MGSTTADCGVYTITNKVTGDCYVGSSKHIRERWATHWSKLTLGKHDVDELQADFDNYGADAFDFSLVEECKPTDDLRAREQHHIWRLRATYNRVSAVSTTLPASEYYDRTGIPAPELPPTRAKPGPVAKVFAIARLPVQCIFPSPSLWRLIVLHVPPR